MFALILILGMKSRLNFACHDCSPVVACKIVSWLDHYVIYKGYAYILHDFDFRLLNHWWSGSQNMEQENIVQTCIDQ